MIIQNIAKPGIRRNTTKELWEKMPDKYKKLFKIIDPTDSVSKEIVVTASEKLVDKHTKQTPDAKVPPPTGEPSEKKRKKKKGSNTNDES